MKIHTINDLNNAVDMLCRVLETRLTCWDETDKTWHEKHPFTAQEGAKIKAKLLDLVSLYPTSKLDEPEVTPLPQKRTKTKRLLK